MEWTDRSHSESYWTRAYFEYLLHLRESSFSQNNAVGLGFGKSVLLVLHILVLPGYWSSNQHQNEIQKPKGNVSKEETNIPYVPGERGDGSEVDI